MGARQTSHQARWRRYLWWASGIKTGQSGINRPQQHKTKRGVKRQVRPEKVVLVVFLWPKTFSPVQTRALTKPVRAKPCAETQTSRSSFDLFLETSQISLQQSPERALTLIYTAANKHTTLMCSNRSQGNKHAWIYRCACKKHEGAARLSACCPYVNWNRPRSHLPYLMDAIRQ